MEFSKTLKNFLVLSFLYLYKNGTERASCEKKWLLNRVLHTARICNHLIYEWIHLKESSIMMFLVLTSVKELL